MQTDLKTNPKMKSTLHRRLFPSALAATWLAVSVTVPTFALTLLPQPPTPLPPRPYADAAPADEITRTGVIERRVAIGGETIGWVLRDEKGKKIELSLPPAAFATIREGMHVVIKGKLGTKKYLERGEVTMFHVREISEIVH